jgi:hypothetical protein
MFRIFKRNILLIEKNLFKKRGFVSNEFEKMPVFKSSYSLDKIYPKTKTSNDLKVLLIFFVFQLNYNLFNNYFFKICSNVSPKVMTNNLMVIFL